MVFGESLWLVISRSEFDLLRLVGDIELVETAREAPDRSLVCEEFVGGRRVLEDERAAIKHMNELKEGVG